MQRSKTRTRQAEEPTSAEALRWEGTWHNRVEERQSVWLTLVSRQRVVEGESSEAGGSRVKNSGFLVVSVLVHSISHLGLCSAEQVQLHSTVF